MVGLFREREWAEKAYFPFTITENGCLLSKKEAMQHIFRNRYLEKKGSPYIPFKEIYICNEL